MPRRSRIDAPSALHHLIIRGIDRSAIFRDAEDARNFLHRLGTILTETSTSCYAWALIPNHVHLLLRTGVASLSTVMGRLLTGYAQQFNRRYHRSGHLFQNRYKSILCEEEPYLLELVRYLHLNPLRAGVVKTMEALDAFPGSGHAVLMGRTEAPWQDTEYVLSFFGRTRASARKAYRSFVEEGIEKGQRPELTGGGLIRSMGGWSALKEREPLRSADERILGGSAFVDAVLKQAHERYEQRTLMTVKGLDLAGLIAFVGKRFGLDERLLRSTAKQRGAARARAIVCHVAIDRLRMKGSEVAATLGITPSGVCKLAQRGRSDPEGEDLVKDFLEGESTTVRE